MFKYQKNSITVYNIKTLYFENLFLVHCCLVICLNCECKDVTSVSAGDVACSVGRTGAPLLAKCPSGRPWWLVVVVGRLKEGPVATANSAGRP